MNIFKSVGTKVKTFATNAPIKFKKNLPEIALVTGVALTVGATVLACKQTLKLNDILDTHHEQMKKINDVKEGAKFKDEDGTIKEYDDSVKVTDKICVYRDTIFSCAKLYALPAVCMTVGEALKVWAFLHEKKEAVMYASIANTAMATLNSYRDRWRERVGDEEEADVFYDRKKDEMTFINDDGKGNVTKETVISKDANIPAGTFSFILSPETSELCDDNLRYMLPVLKAWEEEFNDRCFAGINGGEIITANRVRKFMGCGERGDWMNAGWVPRKYNGKVKKISFGIDKYFKPIEEGGVDFERDGYFIIELNCEYINEYF